MIRRLVPVFAAALLALPANAQDSAEAGDDPAAAVDDVASGALTLELNNAATLDGGACQLTYVAANTTEEDLAQASYQVAFFDGEGVVRRLLVLEFGALAPGRTRIVLFNLPEQPCEDLSRILINEVAACDLADGGTSDVCLSRLETAARGDIQFGL
ncbi:hypothetical protein [Jannaschia aquimarina]|uniref:Tat pathway signal sequence domain protein n=1 Tax=Jannaschia aquimarina TaxID=935700 RepID=A0A0D1EK10_9RHOB|nr:hypothetical protein [Jannaschia aquimarina]KIT17909.1 hypothetical protein jaqu_03340 [Jannaschia aquimarina]SNT23572.1 hypothetical protein SAMN05421775_108132 [Jannaschia aquimarina]